MRYAVALALGLMSLVTGSAVWASEAVSVASTPPVIVKTVPSAGDTQVDPSTSEIRITFSKDMMTREMWSWVIHTPDTFPTVAGDVHYLGDKRTNVLPVKLEPGKTYALWVNSPNGQHNAFRDAGGQPAVPYLLVFKTRSR